jgi:hypothetical protein
MRVAIVGTMMLLTQASGAFAQAPCNIACTDDHKPFAGCKPSSLERPVENRIGIVGKVLGLGMSSSCMGRASIEVVKASVDGLPAHLSVEYHPCERWGAHDGKVVDFYVWQNVRPGAAYSHAPCPD